MEQIHENSPQIDRVADRIERATDRFDLSIKHGMHQIEDIIFNLDYTKLKEGLYMALRTHTFELNDSVKQMKDHNTVVFNQLHLNDVAISKNGELLLIVEEKIVQLTKDTKVIPLLNKHLNITTSILLFVGGMVTLYVLSLITWLPKPYYATAEQAQLLQMVQDETIHLVPDALDSLKVTINYNNTNNKTGENQ
jgi:hypothetical protein